MDIKHVFSLNPLLPAYQPPRPYARRRAAAPLGWVEFAGGLDEIGHDGAGFRLRQRDAAPQGLARAVPARDAAGHLRRVSSSSSTTAAIAAPEFWLSDGWATVQQQGWEAPLYWRCDGRRLAHLHAVRRAAARPGRAGLPCQLLRGRRLRQMGRQAPADRGRMGDRRRRPAARRQSRPTAAISIRAPTPRGGEAGLRQMIGDVWEWTASPYVALSAVSRGRRRDRRIQRQVHVEPDGAARRRGGDAGRPYPRHLPQFLPALGALGVFRAAPRGGCVMHGWRQLSPFTIWRRARRAFATRCWPGSSREPKIAALQVLLRRSAAPRCSRGSAEVPEYYLTRTEIAILEDQRRRHRRAYRPACRLIELGSGASRKVRILLAALDRPAAYVPVDISREHLREARGAARRRFPRSAGRRGLRRLHAALPAAAAARAGRASGSGFSRLDDRQFRAGGGRRVSLRNCARVARAGRRDADRRRPQEGSGDPRRGL